MLIRQLDFGEIDKYQTTILELLVESYMTSFQLSMDRCLDLCREKLTSLKGHLHQNSATILGALENENLVGFLWLFKHDFLGEVRLHVNHIAVGQQCRGKGIGRELMLEAEKLAKLNDIMVVDLYVSEMNLAAADMYGKLGYRTERRYMSKKLN